MSHVWGQTLPSNYGRLPPSAQREFNTLIDDVISEGGEKVFKELLEEIEEKIGKEAFKEIEEQVAREVGEEISEETMEKAMKLTLEEASEDANAETIEALLKKNLKSMAEEAGQKTTKTITTKTTKEAVEQLPEGAIERVGKTVFKTGAAAVTAIVIFNDFMGSDAVNAWVKSSTGQDCDEKAEAASLVEGTPEFTEHVTECQEKAAESLGAIGKIITYGGLAIGGLIAVSILGKLGLFSGSSGDGE